MNYTETYHLPQWKKEDRVMMEDFNQMCADIESGLSTVRNEARQSSQALSARISAAQDTADTARAEAAVLPYAMGKYEGGFQSIYITVGFRPRAVLIARSYTGGDSGDMAGLKGAAMLFLDGTYNPAIEFLDDGFHIWPSTSTSPSVNGNNKTFFYIALQ